MANQQHWELLEDALRKIAELKRNADELKQRIQDLERQPKMAVGQRGPIGPEGPVGSMVSEEYLRTVFASLLTEYRLLDETGLPYAGPWSAQNDWRRVQSASSNNS